VRVELAGDERPLGLERASRLGDDGVDPRLERLGARRQQHAAPGAHEDGVAEALADAREGVAHRRRGEPDAPRGAG
jgi:hypothetical protein